MKEFIISSWETVMDSQQNPLRHLDLASQHHIMQALGWMWSMIFSLSFLSIFHFSYVWMAHLLILGGVAFTVSVFREAEANAAAARPAPAELSSASRCVWKLDSEA